MRARLSEERLGTILSLASRVYSQPRVSVENARRLLGLMASASAVVLLAYFTHEACRGGFARLPQELVANPRAMLFLPSHLLQNLFHWTCRSCLETGVQMGAPSDRLTVLQTRQGWSGGGSWTVYMWEATGIPTKRAISMFWSCSLSSWFYTTSSLVSRVIMF